MVHQTETIGTAGSIQKSFSGPEVHMKVLSMHADSSSPSAAAKYLIDKRSESSMSAMMSESMVSMSSSSQTKKISVFSHTEASSSLETLSSELKKGETHSCENPVTPSVTGCERVYFCRNDEYKSYYSRLSNLFNINII